jgi:hypothetical protein
MVADEKDQLPSNVSLSFSEDYLVLSLSTHEPAVARTNDEAGATASQVPHRQSGVCDRLLGRDEGELDAAVGPSFFLLFCEVFRRMKVD